MGYSRDIRMYRVCVGYVSGMYRESVERYKERKGFSGTRKEGKISPTDSTDEHGNQKDLVSLRKRRNLNYLNNKRSFIYNNNNNINQQHIARKTTHCALKGDDNTVTRRL